MGNYPTQRRSAPCPPGCTCGRHHRAPVSAEMRAKVSAAQKGVPERHAEGCGCFRCAPVDHKKHGECTRKRRSPEYVAWQNMRGRCLRSTHPSYAHYGGRGITIDPRWSSFDVFLADVGRRPGPGYSLDRINNDGNYEPGNCRWATSSEQQNNKRPAVRKRVLLTDEVRAWIQANSGNLSQREMARRLGISQDTVSRAVRRPRP